MPTACVSFRVARWSFGMAVGALILAAGASAQPAFTVVAVPDTQFYSESTLGPGDNFFDRQTRWIVDNAAAQSIVFVTHLGDVVDNAGPPGAPLLDQWDDAVRAMAILRNSTIPHGVLPGNHDWTATNGTGSLEHYRVRFGDTSGYFDGRAWFLGFDPRGVSSAQRFTTPLGDMLHLSLEWNFAAPPTSSDRPGTPRDTVAWAQAILDANPGLPTIVSTHNSVNGAGVRDGAGTLLFERLVRGNDQIFLVLNGHYSGEARIDSVNDFGRPVYELVSDYQSRNRGGDGWLRLMTFEPASNRVRVRTYTPIGDAVGGVPAGAEFANVGRLETDANSAFDLPIEFATRFAPPPPKPLPPPAPVPGTPLVFKRGVNGYVGVDDTEVRTSNPAGNLSAQGYIHIDTDDTLGGGPAGPSYGLIRFSGLSGPGAAQVPLSHDMLAGRLRLYVHPQRSNSEGSGFEVRRMLVPWTSASTWNSLTLPGTNAGSPAGIAANGSSGFEALARPDSAAGTNGGTVGVTTDQWLEFRVDRALRAWAAGQPNNGWLLQTYPNGTNAVRVESSDSTLAGAAFPELIITPTRDPVRVRVFTAGVDTTLSQAAPGASAGTGPTLTIDASVENDADPSGSDVQGLIRFTGVFGSGTGQIPPGALVSSAVLSLNVSNAAGGDGSGFAVHRMLRAWSVDETWTTAGGGISTDGVEAALAPDDAAGLSVVSGSLVQAGVYALDVTDSMRRWSTGGEPANLGWALVPLASGTNAVLIDSFESSTSAGGVRPRLTVRYVCPADFNADGATTTQDLFDFLAGFFAASARADIAGDGLVSVQDIFDFLARWFEGC